MKTELPDDVQVLNIDLDFMKLKKSSEDPEAGEYRCCICFTKCLLRSDMLQHYKYYFLFITKIVNYICLNYNFNTFILFLINSRSHAADVEKTREKRPESPKLLDGGFIKCTHCSKVVI